MKKQPSDTETIEIHHDSLLDEEQWIEKANELLDAAKIMEPAVDNAWTTKGRNHIIDIHSMLVAFAIENLLKAYIVKTQSSRVSSEVKAHRSGGKKPCVFNHNINELIKTAGIKEFNDPSWNLLFDRLTHLAVWAARYPASTAPDGLGLPVVTSFGDKYIITHLREEADRDNLRSVVDLLKKKLKWKAEQGPSPYAKPEAAE